MKKIATRMLCAALVSSVILCGCNQVTETTVPAAGDTEAPTSAATTAAETEPAPTESSAEINVDNMMKVSDLYASKEPEGKNSVWIYSDGIRGGGNYSVDDGVLRFSYTLNNGSTFDVRLRSGKRTAEISFDLIYKEDQRLSGSGSMYI